MKKCLFVLAMLGMVIYAVSCAQTEVNTAGDGTCLAENDERTYAVQEHFEHTNETDCLEENNDSDFLSSGNDAVLSDEPVCGGVTLCPVHPVEFHSYSSILINYVGGDVFAEWIADNDNMVPTIEGCTYYGNIYRFIHDFKVPREFFESMYYGTPMYYYEDHNVDLLYGDDEEAVNQYYLSYLDRTEEREKYQSFGEIKYRLVEYASASTDLKMQSFFDEYCNGHTIADWSISDFVEVTGISKDELISLVNGFKVKEYPNMTVVLNCFDFDYDSIYGEVNSDDSVTVSGVYSIDKHNEDMEFCRQPQLSVDLEHANVSAD